MAYHSNGGYSGDERESRSGDDRPDSDLGDKPIYVVEHLATFTVNKETGISFPADGMRKLLQLEKTTGIWSQKMQLCLDRQWVMIIDYETGNVMERFSVSHIQEPTAFTSQDPMSIYNNILVFIVGSGHSRSEMHIFQCQSVSAQHLSEDLRQLRNGKIVTQHRDSLPPAPPQRQQQQQQQPQHHQQEQQHHHQQLHAQRDSYNYNHETDSELGGLNDETSSTSSDKYERDVTVLNHCFDDIEKFIARLQHAAAATKELERRKRNRKSKKKDPGEGLLLMRTRPPTEKEFIDIFAKFKLSFNLLAKLKTHIHDPNAPELIHFLFTPLALIVDASHDSCYDPHLPSRVFKPLLTREAINLLVNCVTSKETELWRSLGDAWGIPRDQWKGHVGSYHPVFFDGWSPDYPVIDELDNPSTPTNMTKRIDQNYSTDYDYDIQSNDKYVPPGSPGLRDFSTKSEISIDSIDQRNGGQMAGASGILPVPVSSSNMEHQGADVWLENLRARNAKIVQVTYPRTANNEKELTVIRGEYLEIIDDSRNWWKAKNSRGHAAHVPHTIVTPYNYMENGDSFNNPLYPQSFNKGANRQTSEISGYSEDISPQAGTPTASGQNWPNKNIDLSSDEDDYIQPAVIRSKAALTGAPAPAPPPPPMPPKAVPVTSAPPSRNNTLSRKSMQSERGTDDYQDELKEVLTLFRNSKRPIYDITKTPEIFIQQSSSPKEVEDWLKAKNFNDRTLKSLNGLSGNQLMSLNKKTMEEYCGPKEGQRLYSQVLLQQKFSGWKTTRSSELQAILAKAKQKSEQPTTS